MDHIVGKVVLIIGGAGGIGVAIVKKFLQNGAKAAAIVDSSEDAGRKAVDELANTFGKGKAVFIKADITVKEQLEGAFETAAQIHKQLDIVINSAGIVDEFNWEKTLAVNLSASIEGTYLAMQKYFPKYKSGEEGVIVNIASTGGLEPMQYAPVYCATKHALIGLGRSMGEKEFYKKYKVRVLTLCPGAVRTQMTQTTKGLLFPETEESKIAEYVFQSPESVGEALIEAIQKGRNGSLWVTEANEPAYEIVVPHYKTMRV